MPSKKYHIDLSFEEQHQLKELIAKRSAKGQLVKRAYVLLAADRNGEKQWKDSQIAESYHPGGEPLRTKTVENIRQRFVEEGFEIALHGKPREVVPEKVFDGEVEAKLIALRCSNPPAGYSRWTLHLLAGKMVELKYVEHISHESVRQLLKKTR